MESSNAYFIICVVNTIYYNHLSFNNHLIKLTYLFIILILE